MSQARQCPRLCDAKCLLVLTSLVCWELMAALACVGCPGASGQAKSQNLIILTYWLSGRLRRQALKKTADDLRESQKRKEARSIASLPPSRALETASFEARRGEGVQSEDKTRAPPPAPTSEVPATWVGEGRGLGCTYRGRTIPALRQAPEPKPQPQPPQRIDSAAQLLVKKGVIPGILSDALFETSRGVAETTRRQNSGHLRQGRQLPKRLLLRQRPRQRPRWASNSLLPTSPCPCGVCVCRRLCMDLPF